MRFSDYPFLKYLPLLIGGICIGQKAEFINLQFAGIVLGLLWLIYFFLLSLRRSNSRFRLLSIVGYSMIFFMGVFLMNLKMEKKFSVSPEKSWDSYLAEVQQFDLKKPNSFENLLKIKAVEVSGNWEASSGQVIIYHQAQNPLLPGQILKIKQSPETIDGPKNPHEFDYRAFLARKGIHFRQFIGTDFQILDSLSAGSSDFFLINLRNQLAERINSQIPDEQSRQIAMALLLGQKQSLDRDLRAGYVQAGVMHILAVSGLHVGIIYALLLALMKPFKLSKKWSRIYLLLVVGMIWLYAFITGLSPSVVRAATMFSLIALGQLRDRKPSVFNILAFSAMLMIVIDPEVIFDVGFQLSYLAVAGIVLIQPLILNWWLPQNRILEYIWQLTAVSLAAQLITFPLSVFYFHVFPTYFLLGNLLILPLAFLIMQVGVPLLFLGWIPVLGTVLGWILSKLIWFQNLLVQLIQLLPFGKIERLTISYSSMILCWFFLLIWAGWATGKKKQLIYLSFGLIFAWSGMNLYQEILRPVQELYVYQGKSGQAFDYRFGDQLFAWNAGIEAEVLSYLVEPNRIEINQALIPLPMVGIPLSEDQLKFFPSPMIFSPKSSQLYFQDQPPKQIAIWSDGTWRAVQIGDTLKLGESAFRILF